MLRYPFFFRADLRGSTLSDWRLCRDALAGIVISYGNWASEIGIMAID